MSSVVEEEILVVISGLELTCFVTYWACRVEVGKCYSADISILLLDGLNMTEQKCTSNTGFTQRNNSFAYTFCGKFDFDSHTVDAGLQIKFEEDEFDLHDFAYLDGKYVEFEVDRITVSFLNE